MNERIEAKLREAGEQLREEHDDAIIADVIGEVEQLDSEASDATAKILRTMVRE